MIPTIFSGEWITPRGNIKEKPPPRVKEKGPTPQGKTENSRVLVCNYEGLSVFSQMRYATIIAWFKTRLRHYNRESVNMNTHVFFGKTGCAGYRACPLGIEFLFILRVKLKKIVKKYTNLVYFGSKRFTFPNTYSNIGVNGKTVYLQREEGVHGQKANHY